VHETRTKTTAELSPDDVRAACLADPVFRQRYEGWELLGRGSHATVVRTFSRDAAHEVALKIFVDLEPGALARIREEVRAAQSVATPFLVQARSLFDRGQIAWFEMELVDGPNLQQELDRLAAQRRRFAAGRANEIALAVARCLWQVHRAGLVHRDVKPANVLLPSSAHHAAKLTDFGIARLMASVGPTPDGAITGTPRFASPEALAGKIVGPAHDVFGLCVTLYAIFSGGRHPFNVLAGLSLSSLRRMHEHARPVPISRWTRRLDPALRRLLMDGLSADPLARPRIEEFVLRLEAMIGASVHLPAAAPAGQATGDTPRHMDASSAPPGPADRRSHTTRRS